MNNFLDTLKSLAALLKDQHALEEETSKAVLATVADNACTWVSDPDIFASFGNNYCI